MENEVFNWLANDSGFGTYLAVFIMLLLGGIGFPIPEDVPIALAGIAVSKSIVSIPYMFLVCYIGVLVADQVLYVLGYYFGNKLLSRMTSPDGSLFSFVTEERLEEIREGLRRKRFLYILLGRHFYPFRTATFLAAGALRIPFFEFLLSDMLAATISVSVVMFIGWLIGWQLLDPGVFEHISREFPLYVLGIVVFFMLPGLYRRYRYWDICRKRRARG